MGVVGDSGELLRRDAVPAEVPAEEEVEQHVQPCTWQAGLGGPLAAMDGNERGCERKRLLLKCRPT